VDDLVKLAGALLPERGGEIVLMGVVIVPEGHSISEGALPAQTARQAMAYMAARFPDCPIVIRPRVRVAHQVWAEVLAELAKTPVDLLLVPWDGPDQPVLSVAVDQVLSQAPCDLVLVRGCDVTACQRILLPLRGGPHALLALHVAGALARISNGEITLLHVAGPRGVMPELAGLRQREPFITRIIRLVGEPAPGIVREAREHQAIVMGATIRDLPDGGLALGPVAGQVLAQTEQVAHLLVRAHHLAALTLPGEPMPAASAPAPDPSDIVDRWFASNTFHSDEFADLEQLLRWKQERGHSISLALPALNEAKTIGNVIATLKQALMDDVPLLDEIVLIDSNSTDDTRQIAASLGIPVYIHQQVLSDEVGSLAGKGEALWKSLYVTRGDIVAWVDTDIVNIHPRFVYGLLGPLLCWDMIQYVKGFYRRPTRIDGVLVAGGGGRVTELVARPLLNLFFPELSGLVQPLSGEYAGRRQALEQLPFFSGYGVETGLLIDVLERFGLRAIAQVDLQERIHLNQPLVNLSRMAFAIIQVFVARLEARNKVKLLEDIHRSMKLIRYEPGRFFLKVEQIADVERPPMITVPAYRRAHGRS